MTSCTFSEVRDAIVVRFLAEMETLGYYTPDLPNSPNKIALDNEDYTPPNDLTQEWIRFSVRNGGSVQDSIGAVGKRWFVRDGYIYANIYAPLGTSNGILDRTANHIRQIFEGVRIPNTSIRFTGASFNEQEVPEGKYFEGVVRIDFTFDEML